MWKIKLLPYAKESLQRKGRVRHTPPKTSIISELQAEAQKDSSLHPVPGWTCVGPGRRPPPLPAAPLRPTARRSRGKEAAPEPESRHLRLPFQGRLSPRASGKGQAGPWRPGLGGGGWRPKAMGYSRVRNQPRGTPTRKRHADRRCGEGKPPATSPPRG